MKMMRYIFVLFGGFLTRKGERGKGNLQEYFMLKFHQEEVTLQVYFRTVCAMSQTAPSHSLNEITCLCSWVAIIHPPGSNQNGAKAFRRL